MLSIFSLNHRNTRIKAKLRTLCFLSFDSSSETVISFEGRMKSGLYKCTEEQPVPGHNRWLSTRRHLGSQSSYRQSRASCSRLKNKAGEAAFVNPNALSIEGQLYNLSFPNEEDTYYNADSLLGNAVKVCRWLFHHHFI